MNDTVNTGENRTILVVEDDEDIAALVRLKLAREGRDVRIARCLSDAMAAVAETPPTLMLLDLVLADEDGRKVVEALSRRGDLPPFIVMTAHGDQRIAVEMMRLGARDYIIKDSRFIDGISRVIDRVLDEVSMSSRLAEAEDALRNSDRLYRKLFESIEDVFWIVDWTTRTTIYASLAYSEVWGLSREDLYSRSSAWVDSIHPDDRTQAWEAFAEMSDEETYDQEYRIVRPDGRVRHIRDRGFPIVDEDGQVRQVVGFAQDITELRRSEEVELVLQKILESAVEEIDLNTLLARIHQLLGTLIDTSNFFVALYDEEARTYRFPFFVDQAESVDPTESWEMPSSLTDYVRRNGTPMLADAAAFAELQNTGEVDLVGPESAVWLGAPLNTDHGVIGVVSVQSYDDASLYSLEDLELLSYAANTIAIVVERKWAESALRESETRLREIVEHSSNLFYSHTTDHVLTYLSPQSLEILGYEPEEAFIRWTEFATDNPINERGLQSTMRAIETGQRQPPYELELRAKGGRSVWVEVRETPVVENGTTVAIVGALSDITEHRMLEQRLIQAQKLEATGQLAGGIAHDFNNLLMSILGSAELMRLQNAPAGTESREVTAIREAVKRGAELTRGLLAIAHQQVLNMKIIDLRTEVETEMSILRRVIPENIEIGVRLTEDPAVVRADRGQIGQVLMNLVVNARDSMPAGGTVTISIDKVMVDHEATVMQPGAAEGAYVRLAVEDNGEGMDTATLTHVFEPFFTTKVKGSGTGMGLATVWGIIKQHGGFIEVESAPAEGARFEIFLPAATGPVDTKDDSGEKTAEHGDETILVVEDEAAVRQAVVGMLEALGYTVITAADGGEALDVLRGETTIDLVLSDVVMPTIGGRELLARAREIRPGLVFLFSSGYTDEAVRDLLDSDEAASFIHKPFTVATLARTVRDALEERNSL